MGILEAFPPQLPAPGVGRDLSIQGQGMRIPAEVFPPGEFIADELEARGWTTRDLAERMGGDADMNQLVVDMLVLVPVKGMLLGTATARQLAAAFGTPAEFWVALDRSWQEFGA